MSPSEITALCDPEAYTLSDAIQRARQLKEFHPMLDLELAQMTPGKAGDLGGDLRGAQVERALEIIDAISEGSRVLHRLIHFLQDGNERIRSKAALLIGKRVGGMHWAERTEADQNHRVRANAIEALWDSPLPQCRDMFYRALRDSDNRVVGNAIYGIYRLSTTDGAPLLTSMAAEDDPGRRLTAAWVMGKTEDKQFLPTLQTLMRDEEKRVRSTALQSMFRITQKRQPASITGARA